MIKIYLRNYLILIITLILLATAPATAETPVAGSYAGGDGTQGNPYQISTLAELRLLSETPADWVADTYFILTADIDATDTNTWNIGNHDNDNGTTPDEVMGFSPIGDDIQETKFFGVLNGQNHVIINLYINRPGYDYIGLFGYTGYPASFSNVGIEGGYIRGSRHVGALVGLKRGTVTSCHASASVIGYHYTGGLIGTSYGITTSSHTSATVVGERVNGLRSYQVGGLIGSNYGTLSSCYATATVTAHVDVGGLIGSSELGTIQSCYATGDVTADATGFFSNVGGLIGFSDNDTITSCEASGDVSGIWSVGGLVGHGYGSHINTSSATGSVTGIEKEVGGLVGDMSGGGTITSCFATGNVSGKSLVGGLAGGAYFITSSYATGDVIGSGAGGLVGHGLNITSSYATGNVSGTHFLGGLAGIIGHQVEIGIGGNVEFCYATGNVSGVDYVGGLVGKSEVYSSIAYSHSTGAVSGDNYVGGLIAENHGETITWSYATGAVSGNSYVGGLIGLNDLVHSDIFYHKISFCYATGDVNATGSPVGGFIGSSSYLDPFPISAINSHLTTAISDENYIISCYATGSVTVSGDIDYGVGGFVGYVGFFGRGNDFTINSCYATGAVTVSGEIDGELTGVGGFVGYIARNDINSCYATGAVIASGEKVGGFVGYRASGSITSCYWDLDTSLQATSDEGTGLTSAQMKLQGSYDVNWDFDTNPDWVTIEGETRPYFPWQIPALFEGTATTTPTQFTLDTGYVHNVIESGVILDEYGVVYHEDESSDLIYYNFTEDVLYEDESVSLDGALVDELLDDTNYWYRAYAVDSDGTIHYGTERKVTTLTAVYVDFDNGSPNGTGTEEDPVDTLSAAVILAPENGLIKIAPGTTTEIITIDQPVTLKRNGESGSVIIGN